MASYKKIEKIDSGGFGCVYRAQRVNDGELVAFKELAGGTFTDADRARFFREVRIQSSLEHANIVPILGSNLTVNPPFFVMPLAKSSLRRELAAKTFKNDTKRVVTLFLQVLDGLHFAHTNGIIHRDLKPENLLLYKDIFDDDWIRIADFGLGKRIDAESLTITQSYEGLGTVSYMAPEQCHDLKHVDKRADVFSLGKILYELMTHEFPLYVNTHNTALPRGYGYIIGRCLEHDPNKRYQSVEELKQEIQILTSGQRRFDHPQKRIETLINAIESGHGDAAQMIKQVDQLFQDNAQDEAFFTRYFVQLKEHSLAAYVTYSASCLRERFEVFDSYVSGSLPFGYTDTVADFMARVWEHVSDDAIRRMILARLLDMGASHNRWHVGEVFGNIIKTIDDEDTALMARDILRANPRAASWVRAYCGGGILPVIQDGFPSEET